MTLRVCVMGVKAIHAGLSHLLLNPNQCNALKEGQGGRRTNHGRSRVIEHESSAPPSRT